MKATIAIALLLAGCGEPAVLEKRAPALETAAIARGVVRDPDAFDPVGLYARDTDRLCVVPQGHAYRVGAYVDYGDGITCKAAGRAVRSGNALDVELGDGCRFSARYDGDAIVFPATLPDACRAACNGRASFASFNVGRLSASASEAAAMRDPDGRQPCAST